MGLSVKPEQALAMFSLVFGRTDKERKPPLANFLRPAGRSALERAQLIEYEKEGRTTRVNLTDAGWLWVAENLNARMPTESQRANRVLEGVLGRLQSYLEQRGDSLSGFIGIKPANNQTQRRRAKRVPPKEDRAPNASKGKKSKKKPSKPADKQTKRSKSVETLDRQIHRIALKLGGGQTRTRVRLSQLRSQLKKVRREAIDDELLAMQKNGLLVLYRIDDPTDIGPDDERAALYVAGYPRHILYLER